MHSQPGMSDWAGVLEVWTSTYYCAEAKYSNGLKNAPKYAFQNRKKVKKSYREE